MLCREVGQRLRLGLGAWEREAYPPLAERAVSDSAFSRPMYSSMVMGPAHDTPLSFHVRMRCSGVASARTTSSLVMAVVVVVGASRGASADMVGDCLLLCQSEGWGVVCRWRGWRGEEGKGEDGKDGAQDAGRELDLTVA